MVDRIVFVEVVIARVTRDLEFRAHSEHASHSLALVDGLDDAITIFLEVQGPVVKGAHPYLYHERSSLFHWPRSDCLIIITLKSFAL